MKYTATLLALAGSAAAFAPAQQSRSSSALAEKPFADALGAQAPVSQKYLFWNLFEKLFHTSLEMKTICSSSLTDCVVLFYFLAWCL